MKHHDIHIHYDFYRNPNKDLPVIVCIHGFLSSSFSFRRLIPLLRHHYNIITVDLPPFGRSAKPKNFTYSYENIANELVRLLKSIGINYVSLIGHSMGGQIALRVALQHPNIVKNIVLLAPSSYLKRSNKRIIYSTYLPFFPFILKRWLGKRGILGNLNTVVYNKTLINDEMIKGYEEPFLNPEIYQGLTRFIRHREGDLEKEQLNQINTPILLLWGKEDKVVPYNTGKRLSEDLVNTKTIIYNHIGHLLPEEDPEQVAKDILHYLV